MAYGSMARAIADTIPTLRVCGYAITADTYANAERASK
jgi:hypothetical protein